MYQNPRTEISRLLVLYEATFEKTAQGYIWTFPDGKVFLQDEGSVSRQILKDKLKELKELLRDVDPPKHEATPQVEPSKEDGWKLFATDAERKIWRKSHP